MYSVNRQTTIHSRVLAQGYAFLALLDDAKLEPLGYLIPKLQLELDANRGALNRTQTHKERLTALKTEDDEAEANLEQAVGSTYAYIQITEPEFFAALPLKENWVDMPASVQANRLLEAIRAAGKPAGYCDLLTQLTQRRAQVKHALVVVGSVADSLFDNSTAVARLKLLIAEIDLALRPYARPGTPLFNLMKEATAAGKAPTKKKAKAPAPTAEELKAEEEKKAADAAKAEAEKNAAEAKAAEEKKAAADAKAEAEKNAAEDPITVTPDLAYANASNNAAKNGVNGIHT